MNDALLLIGHGSARYPDAGSTMLRHVGALRDEQRFSAVEMGLLNGAPTVAEALDRIKAPVIRVVPFFMEDGYFSQVAVPRALRGRDCIIGPPVGVHDGMAGIITRQALDPCRRSRLGPHLAAVVVVGHGSSSAPGRALALHRHVARVAESGVFARVFAACLEEAPFVADTLRALRGQPVVVVGFFANQGGHVRDDVPALVSAEQAARGGDGPAVIFHGCVADDPAITQIILDQARRAVSRASRRVGRE